MPDTPNKAAREAERWAARGFRAIRMGWGSGFGLIPEHDAALVAAVRRAVGPQVDLLLDHGFRWERPDAVAAARRLEEHWPFWFEEPFLPDSLDGDAQLADAVKTRIVVGEENTPRWEFRDLIDRGHVDVIPPDVTPAGELTECRRIARMAADQGHIVAPHCSPTRLEHRHRQGCIAGPLPEPQLGATGAHD